jgi:hypothetical protein
MPVPTVQVARHLVDVVDLLIEFSYRIGSKWGASERCFPATAGNVRRLKPLVEPHPATLRNSKDSYGMQKARVVSG